MSYDRRPDRRGGRPSGGRPDRAPRDRGERPPPRDFERPARDFGDRPPREFGGGQGGRAGGFGPRPPQRSTFTPRTTDDGGMSIRLDPRRLSALKLLAAEAGVRPGELVTRWVEERLDAARSGQAAPASPTVAADALAELSARLDELARRMDAMTAGAPKAAGAPKVAAKISAPAEAAAREPADEPAVGTTVAAAPAKRRPGRPRKHPEAATKAKAEARVPLHEEIAAVIGERGPMTAAEIAAAIVERGRYAAPRTAKPLDAATVNSRVSNPTYRSRFARNAGRIGLADRS